MSLAVLLPLYLEAHNPEHNHYRAYDLTLAQDLLGDWVVVVRQGRCGPDGERLARPRGRFLGRRAVPGATVTALPAERAATDRVRVSGRARDGRHDSDFERLVAIRLAGL